MYRAVIADDELMIREGLFRGIDWDAHNVEIVGVASNGPEALQSISDKKPDFLITDIRMPGMDGLTLIEKSLEAAPNLICIILTGFGEFSYAHKAIKIGAFDFILKPINIEEFMKVIEKAIEKIKTTKTHERSILESQLIQYTHGFTETVPEKLANYFDQLDEYRVIYIKVGLSPHFTDKSSHTLIAKIQKSEAVLVVPGSPYLSIVQNYVDDINHSRVGISEPYANVSDLLFAYKEARMVVDYLAAEKRKGIGFYSEIVSEHSISDMIDYIDQHYSESISLQEFAAQHYMSDSYLSRLFKKQVGQTFSDYIMHKRIEKAKELLTMTALKTYEVASIVGYQDQRYFSQIFRKATGLTPSEYRREIIEK
ncbi:MAG: response regulator [Tuberibacillus sp.]